MMSILPMRVVVLLTIKDSVKVGPNANNEQEIAPAQSQDGAPMSKDQEGNEPEKNIRKSLFAGRSLLPRVYSRSLIA